MREIETANDQLVGKQGDQVVVAFPRARMTREQAIRHAAWLCFVAEVTGEEWSAVTAAIGST